MRRTPADVPLPPAGADNPLTARMCRRARQLLGWSTMRLGAEAGLSDVTVRNLEKGGVMQAHTLSAIRGAMEAAGIAFTNADATGVRLRKPAE